MPWDALPCDLTRHILTLRAQLLRRIWSAVTLQAHWRGHRTRRLLVIFRGVRYLKEFSFFNPNATAFLARTRL